MRPLWKDIMAAIWLGMLLPGMILHVFLLTEGTNAEPQQQISQEEPSRTVRVLRTGNGIRETVDINTYLTGVILAEMPAGFDMEALKAQSVAARTYTMKAILTGGKHGDCSLCDESQCCQGFVTEADFLSRGGIQESVAKVREAVKGTEPLVLEYEGELIEAVYFSSSGGRTESALAVWGANFPYLQSVASPGEITPEYRNRVRHFTVQEFQERLDIALTDNPEDWFSGIRYTQGGGVESVSICGKEFSGIQLRSQLELPSTVFSLSAADDAITVVSSGYGHRVGLSQYGADAMAKNGCSYEEVLAHYYPGTVLVPME